MSAANRSSVTAALARVLGKVDRSGDYYATGSVVTPIPEMRVEGVGLVSFPVTASQAEALVAAAERAPYGRGEETLIDTERGDGPKRRVTASMLATAVGVAPIPKPQ